MKNFIGFAGSFFKSLPRMLLFELIFKLLMMAMGIPLITFLLETAMKHSGVAYLTISNLSQFLLDPVTALILLVILFISAVISIAELSGLIACCICCCAGKQMRISGMFKSSLKILSNAFRKRGRFHFIGFTLLTAFLLSSLSSGIFSAWIVPLITSLMNTKWGYAVITLFVVIQLVILFFIADKSYFLHFLLLTDSDFPSAIRKSSHLLKGKRFRTMMTIVFRMLIMVIAAAVVTFAISFLIIFVIKGAKPNNALLSSLRVLNYAGKIALAVSSLITAPFIISCLTEKFFTDIDEKIIYPDPSIKKYSHFAKVSVTVVLTAISILLNFSYIKNIYRGNINLNTGIFSSAQITAHRGYSYIAPENTSYAFEEAINIGADYIEFDVQQTKDGQLVVIHDSTLDRTTNGTGDVSDYTYDELSLLSCGEWFKKGDFSDARIMLLSEVFDLVGDDILMNIEIKKQGDPSDTARKAVELLMEYDLEDSCFITSFSYTALRTVKETNPDIKTGLISNIAFSPVYSQLKYIDAISLNYIFVNQNIVSTAHKNGKRVFVWTVNTRSDIDRMIMLGVDNIITDRPDIGEKAVYSYSSSDFILALLEKICQI
jgi:glycerophosphoryl diester phosphodiesterase